MDWDGFSLIPVDLPWIWMDFDYIKLIAAAGTLRFFWGQNRAEFWVFFGPERPETGPERCPVPAPALFPAPVVHLSTRLVRLSTRPGEPIKFSGHLSPTPARPQPDPSPQFLILV